MEQRRSLILHLYQRQLDQGRQVVATCEAPQSGRQQPFRTPEELWSIVLAALIAEVASTPDEGKPD